MSGIAVAPMLQMAEMVLLSTPIFPDGVTVETRKLKF